MGIASKIGEIAFMRFIKKCGQGSVWGFGYVKTLTHNATFILPRLTL